MNEAPRQSTPLHSRSSMQEAPNCDWKENPVDAMTKLMSMQCLKNWIGSIGITDKTGGLM
jgi:hypothetical protein